MEKNLQITAGQYKGKKIFSPATDGTKPVMQKTRQAIFNIINSRFKNDLPFEKMLDLCAGSGSVSFEAVSQNIAKKIVATDVDKIAYKTMLENLKLLQNADGKVAIFNLDAREIISNNLDADFVFLNPPYDDKVGFDLLKHLVKVRKSKPLNILVLCDNNKNVFCKESVEEFLLKNVEKFAISDSRRYGRNFCYFLELK